MKNYRILQQIGEGAYGIVYKCLYRPQDRDGNNLQQNQNVNGQKIYAVKKIPSNSKESARQKCLLSTLSHPNIVKFIKSHEQSSNLYLLFEYIPNNLLQILQKEQYVDGLQQQLVRVFIYQILKGIAYLHANGVLHRDIKPENLLVGQGNVIKICDFGFSRSWNTFNRHLNNSYINNTQQLTDYVATRWYRSPQLLVGAMYNTQIDVWAVGCIMGELVDGNPMFPGDTELDQLYLIQKLLGPVIQAHKKVFYKNPIFSGLDLQAKEESRSQQQIQKRYKKKLSAQGIDLLRKMLKMNPNERISAEQALRHPYFSKIQQSQLYPECLKVKQTYDSQKASINYLLPAKKFTKKQPTTEQVQTDDKKVYYNQSLVNIKIKLQEKIKQSKNLDQLQNSKDKQTGELRSQAPEAQPIVDCGSSENKNWKNCRQSSIPCGNIQTTCNLKNRVNIFKKNKSITQRIKTQFSKNKLTSILNKNNKMVQQLLPQEQKIRNETEEIKKQNKQTILNMIKKPAEFNINSKGTRTQGHPKQTCPDINQNSTINTYKGSCNKYFNINIYKSLQRLRNLTKNKIAGAEVNITSDNSNSSTKMCINHFQIYRNNINNTMNMLPIKNDADTRCNNKLNINANRDKLAHLANLSSVLCKQQLRESSQRQDQNPQSSIHSKVPAKKQQNIHLLSHTHAYSDYKQQLNHNQCFNMSTIRKMNMEIGYNDKNKKTDLAMSRNIFKKNKYNNKLGYVIRNINVATHLRAGAPHKQSNLSVIKSKQTNKSNFPDLQQF